MTAQRPGEPQRLLAGAFASAAVAVILVLAFGFWGAWRGAEQLTIEAKTRAATSANLLAEHVGAAFGSAAMLLTTVAQQLGPDPYDQQKRRSVGALLAELTRDLPHVTAVAIVERNSGSAYYTFSTGQGIAPPLETDDRWRVDEVTGAALAVGRPVFDPGSGTWTLDVTRTVTPREKVGGDVVVARVALGHLPDLFQGFDLGPRGEVAVLREDGLLLAREPHQSTDNGRHATSATAFRRELPPGSAGTFVSASADGIERIFSYRRVDKLPLIVLVGVSREDVLSRWLDERGNDIAISLMVAASVMIVVGFLAYLGRRWAAANKAALLEQERYRRLAESLTDMIVRTSLGGVRLYVSPASQGLLGYSPEELVGTSLDTLVHPEDLDHTRQAWSNLLVGPCSTQTLRYRLLHKEGHWVWCESRRRMLFDADQKPIEAVSIVRDVTESVRLEETLRALSTTDSITEIANRRAFDDRLRAEWDRARRVQAPLGLLCLDLDHFKQFNDACGHAAGDSCLRAVAQLLIKNRRGSDLAARLGGEEFGILLPRTDLQGARKVARAITRSLEVAAISHPASPFSKVTASIGVASLTPADGHTEEDLLRAADRAMYIAKQNGRNQISCAGERDVALVRA